MVIYSSAYVSQRAPPTQISCDYGIEKKIVFFRETAGVSALLEKI